VAAALLDREATAPTLTADPDYGLIHEPILRVVHLLRALEVEPGAGELLEIKVGGGLEQRPLAPDTVFSYFSPFFRQRGRAALAGLVAPVADIMSISTTIVLLNALLDLVRHDVRRAGCGGLLTSSAALVSSCAVPRMRLTYAPHPAPGALEGEGGGGPAAARDAAVCELDTLLTGRRSDPRAGCGGLLTSSAALVSSCAVPRMRLTYAPHPAPGALEGEGGGGPAAARDAAVCELDTLLTGRRSDPATLAHAADGYDADGLRGAQAAFVLSPAFHTLGGAPRPAGPLPAHKRSKRALPDAEFRGLIVLYLNGGADSYNMLVPMGGCQGRDLYQDYRTARSAEYAIPAADLLSPSGTPRPPSRAATLA